MNGWVCSVSSKLCASPLVVLALACAAPGCAAAPASAAAPRLPVSRDPRIRVVPYSADRIYRLRGYAGYQIDVQFASGERIAGVSVGDARSITWASAGDQLFLKPRAIPVDTNVTVLTDRRTYLFEYTAAGGSPTALRGAPTYVLRFKYPGTRVRADASALRRVRVAQDLASTEHVGPRNYDYWFCGAPSLEPSAAWDDGIETHLVFGARADLPAVFVRNADGSESLVNFDMRGGEMIIQRIARRLILRRGGLSGCIVDRAYRGGGRRLASGTIAPDVWRVTRRQARRSRARRGTRASSGEQR